MFLPDGEDPDSMVRRIGKAEFLKTLETDSLNLSDYLVNSLKDRFDLSSLEGKRALLDFVKPLVEKIGDSVFASLLDTYK